MRSSEPFTHAVVTDYAGRAPSKGWLRYALPRLVIADMHGKYEMLRTHFLEDCDGHHWVLLVLHG